MDIEKQQRAPRKIAKEAKHRLEKDQDIAMVPLGGSITKRKKQAQKLLAGMKFFEQDRSTSRVNMKQVKNKTHKENSVHQMTRRMIQKIEGKFEKSVEHIKKALLEFKEPDFQFLRVQRKLYDAGDLAESHKDALDDLRVSHGFKWMHASFLVTKFMKSLQMRKAWTSERFGTAQTFVFLYF